MIILKTARPLGGDVVIWSSRPSPWMTDFKPSKVRINGVIDGEGQSCEIRSYNDSPGEGGGIGNIIGSFIGSTGEVIVNLTYGISEYFGRIVANGYSSISKIEFNEDPGSEPWYDVTYIGADDGSRYWNSGGGSWNSEQNAYVASETNLSLFSAYGGWNLSVGEKDFTPTKMRITGTVVGSETVTLTNSTQTQTIGSAAPASVTILDLTFTTIDPHVLYYLDLTAFSVVTKIEVNFPVGETQWT